jgi:hypothetical protein
MPEAPIQETLLRLRLSVGLLGEKGANGWWPTAFLEPSSRAFLDPVFVRTSSVAQMHGVTEAARRVHDARLAAGSFHLFRLPEEAEQDLHVLIRDLSRSGATQIPTDAAEAAKTLDAIAAGVGVDAPGPKLMGDAGSLGSADAWRQVAAAYRDAFRKGFQSYPYFSRT